MRVYLGQPTDFYKDDDIQKLYIHNVKNSFKSMGLGDIADNDIENPATYILPETDKKGAAKEKFYMITIFQPAIDRCEAFVYTYNFDIKGNIYLTEGVKKELKYAMSKNKRIFKLILFKDNFGKIQFKEMVSMDKQSMETIILGSGMSNKKILDNWVLKSLKDYQLWLDNNKEFIDFLNFQFKTYNLKHENGAKHAVVPHHSSLYATNEHSIVDWVMCRYHQYPHAFIDPRFQEKKITCSFLRNEDTYSLPNYSQWKWDYLGEIPIRNLFLKSRTIHKSMFIFKEQTFHKGDGGIVLRIPGKQSVKGVYDYTKMVGVEPVIDIDITPAYKDKGYTFFDKRIFDQYIKVQKLLHKFMENRLPGIDYKFGFSGNGLYLYIEPFIFEDVGWNFNDFFWFWKDAPEHSGEKKNTIAYLINKMLENNSINALRLESTYAWRSYFKAMGTFHLYLERISAPLNKDEVIDYDWLNKITNLKLGLEGNVINEIIKRANWKW